jgi:hypothetical protein
MEFKVYRHNLFKIIKFILTYSLGVTFVYRQQSPDLTIRIYDNHAVSNLIIILHFRGDLSLYYNKNEQQVRFNVGHHITPTSYTRAFMYLTSF